MVKQNKIRDWETKRDDLNNKLEVCEEKLRNPQQEQRPEDFKVSEGLLTAAIGELCLNAHLDYDPRFEKALKI